MSIIIAILVFGVIILIHEFGHFFAARKCGIKVEEFAIGMGPKILSFKPGETVYSIRIFPIGGSCRMLGEDASTEEYESYDNTESSRAFNNKPVWKRITVILAGVFMNFVLAIVATLIVTSMYPYIDMPVIRSLVPGGPVEAAGFMPGDRIIKANETKVNISADLDFVLQDTAGEPITLTVLRDGEKIQKTVTPVGNVNENGSTRYVVGFIKTVKTSPFAPAEEGFEKASVSEYLKDSFYTNVFYVKATITGLTRLVTLKIGVDQMSGPIGVVDAVSDSYEKAAEESTKDAVLMMLNFMAFLSVNVGVFNLLPLPALDGGRFIFLIVEGIRKKPVKPEIEGMVHLVGLALLMVFALFIAFSDVMKLIN